MDNDWFLIHRIRDGDEVAIESFVRKYYPSIMKYCYYRTSDNTLAEDLTQETFYRFFKVFSSYSHNGRLANYLYAIAGNLCRDYWRSQEKTQIVELRENIPYNSGDIDSIIMLQKAIAELPDEFREVIYMHYYLGMRLQEIAETEELNLSLVKYRLKRGKDLLKKKLGEEDKS